MDIKLSDDVRARVMVHLKNGNKIEAIKLVREETGFGLKESKDFVESLVDNHDRGLPENQQIKKTGCLVFLLIGAFLIVSSVVTRGLS
jgi:ribosomal protein L7/L12